MMGYEWLIVGLLIGWQVGWYSSIGYDMWLDRRRAKQKEADTATLFAPESKVAMGPLRISRRATRGLKGGRS